MSLLVIQNLKGIQNILVVNPILPHGVTQNASFGLCPRQSFDMIYENLLLNRSMGLKYQAVFINNLIWPNPKESPPNGYVTYLWRIDKKSNIGRFNPEKYFNLRPNQRLKLTE